jgi:hypothetical protein
MMRSTTVMLKVLGWGLGIVSAIRGDWFGVLLAAVLLLLDAYMDGVRERQAEEHARWMAESEQRQAEWQKHLDRMPPEEREAFNRAMDQAMRSFDEMVNRRWWHRFTRR